MISNKNDFIKRHNKYTCCEKTFLIFSQNEHDFILISSFQTRQECIIYKSKKLTISRKVKIVQNIIRNCLYTSRNNEAPIRILLRRISSNNNFFFEFRIVYVNFHYQNCQLQFLLQIHAYDFISKTTYIIIRK